MTFFDVFGGSDFGILVVLGFPNPCRGNLGCYFGVSLCFSLCYPKLGIPLTGRPCVFGGVLWFYLRRCFDVWSSFVRFCGFLLVQFVVCLILGHLPPSLATRLSVSLVVVVFLVATTFNTVLSF